MINTAILLIKMDTLSPCIVNTASTIAHTQDMETLQYGILFQPKADMDLYLCLELQITQFK